ncbi:hypothetical protein [Piscinibacter sakaiensis]|uniref:hypothetical protein n=1 Tax=Piscinibacter sakaiensis TaxID=1547922 RepID=UPI003AAAD675
MTEPKRPAKPPIPVLVRAGAVWAIVAVVAVLLAALTWIWLSFSQPAGAPPAPPGPAPATGLQSQPPAASAAETVAYRAMLSGRSADWRVMRLAENPRILVIEFPDLTSQGQAFNRLAALIEKDKAPRDRVLSDEGLARFISESGASPETFFFGHDYTADAVAAFFTLAVNQQIRLNPAELRLGNVLLAAGLLIEQSDRLVANPDRQAVVSFTATQADNPSTAIDESVDARRRETILRHELSHGEFFTNPAYRDFCWAFWQGLMDDERRQLRRFLNEQGYDPRNEELMVNEAQAFLMHTPDTRVFGADRIGMSPARLSELRARFDSGQPASIFHRIDR